MFPRRRIEVGLHDEVRRFTVGEPGSANRRDEGADDHRVANLSHRRSRQQQNDDQSSDGQSDHGDAVKDAGRHGYKTDHQNDRRHDRALVAAQKAEGDAFEEASLGNHGHEKRQAEDEEHGVQVDEFIQTLKREQIRLRPMPPADLLDLNMPVGRFQFAERGNNNQQHSISEGVLVDLIFE